jgi:hypothetical protein
MADSSAPPQGATIISFVRTRQPLINDKTTDVGHPVQLEFEFDKTRKLLLVVTDHLHGATFIRRLHMLKPKIIIDSRFAPHFNFTAVDGAIIKRQIELVGARYVRHSIPFHEFGASLLRHDPMSIAIKLSDKVLENGGSQWPLMILLKEGNVASTFSPFLAGAFSRRFGGDWVTEVVV